MIIITFIFSILISYLFYRSVIAAIFLLPSYFIISKKYSNSKVKKRMEQLNLQFKDAIISISSGLEAGYSFENAIRFAIEDLELMYDQNAYIIQELQRVASLITNNSPVEEAIEQFAYRSRLEDIMCFSEVFQSAKRSGGDLVSIIKHTSKTISEKVEVIHEINTLITAKKLEVSIMKIMPYGVLAYLTVCSSNFLDPLYGNVFGIVFMTVLLLLTLGISMIADKIMDIEV